MCQDSRDTFYSRFSFFIFLKSFYMLNPKIELIYDNSLSL